MENLASSLDPDDFWLSSGHMLLDVNEAGHLTLTPDFLRAYLARPELMPPPEACDNEQALHALLLATPTAPVEEEAIEAIADEDARSNWRVMLGFRNLLMNAPSIEAAYIRLVRQGPGSTPPLLMNQLAHVVARQAFGHCSDPFVLRAAELFFRSQKVTVHDGAILLADEEVLSMKQRDIERAPLLAMFAGETAQMDILNESNAASYRARSDRHDFILEFGAMTGGRAAFAKALEIWIGHLLATPCEITPIAQIEDRDVRWLLGLDTEGTRIGNAIWNGDIDGESAAPFALFQLTAKNADFIGRVQGHPVYLILGMTGDRLVRVKPQNLVTGLPLPGAINN